MKRFSVILTAAALAMAAVPAYAQVTNIKVVTDASPDYTDMPSLVHSITDRWDTPKDKCWALFYWNHIGRRQTSPMNLRGVDLTDPIMQFNDYGFTMCSTVSGINCAIWDFMGMPTRYWEIGLHTVCEVKYDGRYHMYDSSLTALYTLCDGKTIAGVEDIGAEGACEASGGVMEQGHIANYHCLNATSPNGFLTGADCLRATAGEAKSFNPKVIKYQYFYKCVEYGHRYIFNLREGEVYTRYYHRLDADSPNAVPQGKQTAKNPYVADPAYFVPNGRKGGWDPESANPRYHIRGNGIRQWSPPLSAEFLPVVAYSMNGVMAVAEGVGPKDIGKPGEIIFKVEGANVITSLKIAATLIRRTAGDKASIAISADEGRTWKNIYNTPDARAADETLARLNLLDEVNGTHDVLVKVQLEAAQDVILKSIAFEAITEVNAKTQPKLNLGKNTIYVGAGEQTESIVFTPDLRKGKFEPQAAQVHNLTAMTTPDSGRYALLYIDDGAVPKGWVDFKMDSPTDITSFTYGGRMTIRAPKSGVELSHSFDDGKTWIVAREYFTTEAPWDNTHYETITDVPAGTRSVRFRYFLYSNEGTPAMCGLYSVRMELQHKIAQPAFKPMEVTFAWKERQDDDAKAVERRHTQLVDKLPFTYTINVGGADQPLMESLAVNLKGAVQAADVKYGYSDGKDVGGEKWVGRWVTYGKILSTGKPYTSSVPSLTTYNAGDLGGKRLTDGIVASPYPGGNNYASGVMWPGKTEPTVTVDLGQPEKCGGFRIQLGSYTWDAMKGQVPDKVEVLTSADGESFTSQGFFNLKLKWKDFPVNYFWPDDETFGSPNFEMVLPKAVEARYVRFKVTTPRGVCCSEVQVLDEIKYEPFDLKIALPQEGGTPRK